MREQFVTFEISLALKELGFDEPCLGFYYDEPKPEMDSYSLGVSPYVVDNMVREFECIKAPLWQQTIDWLREKRELIVEIAPDNIEIDKLGWYFYIYSIKDYLDTTKKLEPLAKYENWKNPYNYYYAREQAILKAIELCQK